jgi:hypothetical protein
VLIFDRIEPGWRHYEYGPEGPVQQWLYGSSRPWHAAAALAAIIAREARLACGALYLPVAPDVAFAKTMQRWTTPAPGLGEGANLYVQTKGGVLLLPWDRHGWDEAVEAAWSHEGSWHRLIPYREQYQRLVAGKLTASDFEASCDDFIAGFWPDYVALEVEEGPSFTMISHLLDYAVREFNRTFQ